MALVTYGMMIDSPMDPKRTPVTNDQPFPECNIHFPMELTWTNYLQSMGFP